MLQLVKNVHVAMIPQRRITMTTTAALAATAVKAVLADQTVIAQIPAAMMGSLSVAGGAGAPAMEWSLMKVSDVILLNLMCQCKSMPQD